MHIVLLIWGFPVAVKNYLSLFGFCLWMLVSVSLYAAETGAVGAPESEAGAVLITGSNRGIGLEFVRQYAAAGWEVIATCRNPDKAEDLQALAAEYSRVVIEQMDVTDAAGINALATKYADQPLDLLINNAALLGSRAAQGFATQDYDLALRQYEVNVLGPMRVTQAFIVNVRQAGPGKVIILGSAAGSNGYLRPPADFYSYRASKAALHFLAHNLALEFSSENIAVGLFNPGLVDTRGLMKLGPNDPVPDDYAQIVRLIRSGVITLITPAESVTKMRNLITKLGPEQSGIFINYDGKTMPW
jgi:NAD(P)-dependent dehydrogenase (short-subunit alcohol dehydrogenase family)